MLSKGIVMGKNRRKLSGLILTGSALACLTSTTANTTSASFGEFFNGLKGSVTSGLKVAKDSAKNLVNNLKMSKKQIIFPFFQHY